MLISLERPYPAERGDSCGIHAGFLWEIADMDGDDYDYAHVCILVHVGENHPGSGGEGVMLTQRFMDHWYDAEHTASGAAGHGSQLVVLPNICEADTERALCITTQRFYDDALHIPPQEPDSYWRRPEQPFKGFTYAMTICCKLCEFAAACHEEAIRGQYAD